MEKEEATLQETYEILKEKHSLPDFQALAEDFDIEKIQDKESLFLIREIRRAINEKISAYLHLFENLINPASPPMFVFTIIKNISNQDKEIIRDLYSTLAKTQIEIMKLDTIYDEDSEATFIKKTFETWQTQKPKIQAIIKNFEESFDLDNTIPSKSYLD